MGQIEVLAWLCRQRLAGHEDYYTTSQVARGLRDYGIDISNHAVRGNLMCLAVKKPRVLATQYAHNLAEFPGGFRVKKRYIGLGCQAALVVKKESEIVLTSDYEKGCIPL